MNITLKIKYNVASLSEPLVVRDVLLQAGWEEFCSSFGSEYGRWTRELVFQKSFNDYDVLYRELEALRDLAKERSVCECEVIFDYLWAFYDDEGDLLCEFIGRWQAESEYLKIITSANYSTAGTCKYNAEPVKKVKSNP